MAELDDREALGDALNGLPADERQIVVWRYFDELPLDEIGQRYGWSRQVVALVLRRAFAKLQAALAELAAT